MFLRNSSTRFVECKSIRPNFQTAHQTIIENVINIILEEHT